MILTASYSGLLIASALRPQYSNAISNIQDIAQSGIPWDFVRYDSVLEYKLKDSQDPLLKEFWEGKNHVNYNPFPYEKVTSQNSLLKQSFSSAYML